MKRPIVHASHYREAVATHVLHGPTYEAPGIQIDVTFQLHDHVAALEMLDAAVADIRGQIEETL